MTNGADEEWLAGWPKVLIAPCGRPIYYGDKRVDGKVAKVLDHAEHVGTGEETIACVNAKLRELGIGEWRMEQ